MSELAGYNTRTIVAPITGGTADITVPLFPAPFGGVTVTNAYATFQTTLAGNGTNYVACKLLNGGTAGTATAAMGTAGGTAGWTAATPQAFTLNSSNSLTVGQWLVAVYDVNGTISAPGEVVFTVQYKLGKG